MPRFRKLVARVSGLHSHGGIRTSLSEVFSRRMLPLNTCRHYLENPAACGESKPNCTLACRALRSSAEEGCRRGSFLPRPDEFLAKQKRLDPPTISLHRRSER